MRRLFFALPFLAIGVLYLFMDLRETPLIIVTLGWLTFALEYRYGGESKDGEELIALGISMSVVLMPIHQALAELLALFMFILELTVLFVKFKLKA
ncbi:hypothetical protein E3E36_08835 [Thermococcus sp. M36]|uniref:hypothetical protein n=1 Tax=Thermococcus sp. M36 TaxID=1638261 RepID=UPI001438BACD|nr:hypothetical protein [Thermococcus sp. M36]NJE06244.1 hypothetical protein [Thermococcus sp. M36]